MTHEITYSKTREVGSKLENYIFKREKFKKISKEFQNNFNQRSLKFILLRGSFKKVLKLYFDYCFLTNITYKLELLTYKSLQYFNQVLFQISLIIKLLCNKYIMLYL